jgi:hypothetical protein
MLTLTQKIGQGTYRSVWRHPDKADWCIKVTIPGEDGASQNEAEWHYLRHLAALDIRSRHLPREHGWVETNFGRGLVVNYVHATDGTPATTLGKALQEGLIEKQEAIRMVQDAFRWAGDHGVMIEDANLNNLAIHADASQGHPWLVFIDGLGTDIVKKWRYRLACVFRPYEILLARRLDAKQRDKVLQIIEAVLRIQNTHPADNLPPARANQLALTEKIDTDPNRTCWLHPASRALCVKIDHPSIEHRRNEIEAHYLKHLAKRGIQSRHLPSTQGWIDTNLGYGLVLKLHRAPDGSLAPTLPTALRRGLLDATHAMRLVDEVLDWAISHGVMLVAMRPDNFIVCGEPALGTAWLLINDGLGTRRLNSWGYRLACLFRPYEIFSSRRRKQRVRAGLYRLIRREARHE